MLRDRSYVAEEVKFSISIDEGNNIVNIFVDKTTEWPSSSALATINLIDLKKGLVDAQDINISLIANELSTDRADIASRYVYDILFLEFIYGIDEYENMLLTEGDRMVSSSDRIVQRESHTAINLTGEVKDFRYFEKHMSIEESKKPINQAMCLIAHALDTKLHKVYYGDVPNDDVSIGIFVGDLKPEVLKGPLSNKEDSGDIIIVPNENDSCIRIVYNTFSTNKTNIPNTIETTISYRVKDGIVKFPYYHEWYNDSTPEEVVDSFIKYVFSSNTLV